MSNLCIDLNEIASNVGRPHHDKRTIGDPFKTIFVGRLNFNTSEDRLYREFQIVGQVETVRIVKDQKTRKSKGYGFVEFRDERDANEIKSTIMEHYVHYLGDSSSFIITSNKSAYLPQAAAAGLSIQLCNV